MGAFLRSKRWGGMEDSPLVVGLKWFATAATTIAALMVALDIGRRVSGWGFVLFTIGSVAWIAGAVLTEDWPLTTTNSVLFAINLIGVYQYLVRKKPNG
jgi:hypothetical protein